MVGGIVWIVRDHDTLYVDRNANGDLTDDEPLKPIEEDFGCLTYRLDHLLDSDSKRKHTNFEVRVFWGSKKRKLADKIAVYLDIDGRYQEMTGGEAKEKPGEAPMFHLGQPLHMWVPSAPTFTPGKEAEVHVLVSSWKPGSASTAVSHAKAFPKDVHPVAEIT